MTFLQIGAKEAKAGLYQHAQTIFKTYWLGVATGCDEWAFDFNQVNLIKKVRKFVENYNGEVFRWTQHSSTRSEIDAFANNTPTFIKWTDRLKDGVYRKQLMHFEMSNVRNSLYRPFCKKFLFFDHLLNQRRYQQHTIFPTISSQVENAVICFSVIGSIKPFSVLISRWIPDLNLYADPAQCFPYYTYSLDGTNRQENITDWSLTQFQAKYGSEVTKWDIFHYVYAMLHHPQYRERYAENLKRDLPHIPLLHTVEGFRICVRIGHDLMDLHLNYERVKEYDLNWVENEHVPFSWCVEKMKLLGDRTAIVVNESLTLAGIPQECFEYRLGNRSALEWVVDQYQVSKDTRSGIVSDPNNLDDEEYIVHLLGRIVTVSVGTIRLVGELMESVGAGDWMDEV